METMDGIMRKMSGGCLVSDRWTKEEKIEWLEKNAPEWDKDQRETFMNWADKNMFNGEWVLSPAKAAEIIGVRTQTVQKWCKDGKIKAYQNTIGWWHIPISTVLLCYNRANEKNNPEE